MPLRGDDARLAGSFAGVADEYERGRPGYPPAAIDWVTAGLELGPESTVVDLAAGTGKLTRELVGRFARVIAVEPLAEMRAVLARAVPGAELLGGSAEELPLEGGSADAVLVAQAFHWFDGPRALEEIARVLRRGGGIGLLWNTTPWELREGPWFAALDDLLERSRADLSAMRRHGSGRWKAAFCAAPFEPLAERAFRNEALIRRGDFVAGLASRSYVASLPPADRREVLAAVEALLDRPDAPVEGDRVVVPMRTVAFRARASAQ